MAGARTPSKPSFFWQGLLIVLPVVVLVAVGVYSLRQDKRLAQREAEDRARAIADDLVPLIWNELAARETNDLQQPFFTVDANGELISPPARNAVPTPKPFDLSMLNPEQARLWQVLPGVGSDAQNDEALIRTYEAFIDSDPPDNFAAAANYQLGLALVRLKKFPEAVGRFALVAEEYPDAVGESGLPLGQLALFKLFEIRSHEQGSPFHRIRRARGASRIRGKNSIEAPFPPNALELTLDHFVSLESLCSNTVTYPTPLTPYLLRELQERWIPEMAVGKYSTGMADKLNRAGTPEMHDTIRKWQRVWDEHELSRELFASAREHFPTNHLLSVTSSVPSLVEMPQLFWFDTAMDLKTSIPGDAISPSRLEIEEQHWLALRSTDAANRIRYVCLAESEIGMRLRDLLQRVKSLPSYFGVGVELAGKKVKEFAPDIHFWYYAQNLTKSGGVITKASTTSLATNIIASATGPDAGANRLRVSVYLTNPTALFKSQRSRAFSFGVLIAAATIAAAFGLLAAWRAFNRQLHLSEMKSNFVSSVSHELRAPIASVRLLAESLERGTISQPQKQHEYFRFIGQECRRLSALIENVLDFSRIEQGRKQYEFEPTDLGALVEQTVKLMQPYAEERGVRLELNAECGTRSAELNVDGRGIQQALVNLIDNAIKHSPKDAVVTVGLETRSAECGRPTEGTETLNTQHSTLNLSVTDHGPGIPASQHEKIFERFYRLGSELRRETQGVGIGLSIVKHIVDAHGGRVRVESEVGKGSRFTIELPLNQQEQTKITEEKEK